MKALLSVLALFFAVHVNERCPKCCGSKKLYNSKTKKWDLPCDRCKGRGTITH